MAGLVVLFLVAAPAMADLFNFSLSNTHTTWDGTTLTTTPSTYMTIGTVTRISTPSGWALLNWPADPGGFKLTMGVNTSTMVGTGSFTLTDVDGDTITGDITGKWLRDGPANSFSGVLSDVRFHDNGPLDGTFNGSTGSVAMSFPGAPQPWTGTITDLTGAAPWFPTPFSVDNGTVGGNVQAVPVPAALLLGLFGLGTAGLGLRKRV